MFFRARGFDTLLGCGLRILPALLPFFGVLIVSSCRFTDGGRVLALVDADPAGWSRSTLDVVVDDTLKKRDLGVLLRVDARFGDGRLPLKIYSRAPNGEWAVDNLTVSLDASGDDIKEVVCPWRRGVVFPRKGVYTFTITSSAEGAATRGVRAIGIIESLSNGQR